MTDFDDAVVTAVTRHMNDDHAADNLAIVRAFAEPSATVAVMTGLDSLAGVWDVTVDGSVTSVRIPWNDEALDRGAIRREVVALYHSAVERLGLSESDHAAGENAGH